MNTTANNTITDTDVRQMLGYFWDDATNSRTPQGHVVESDWLNKGNPSVTVQKRIVRFDLCWGDVQDPASFSSAEVVFDILNDCSYKVSPQFYCPMTPEQMHAYIQILLDLEKWAEREAAYMRSVAPQVDAEQEAGA